VLRALVILTLAVAPAFAEQPHGEYALDRGAREVVTDEIGKPWPTCGDSAPNGQATYVVEYGGKGKVVVNGREWRFWQFASKPGQKPRADAPVVIHDRDGNGRLVLWFWVDGSGAHGTLSLDGTRNDARCVDAWRLSGRFNRGARP
jgi:hypothetical protein